MGTDLRAFLYHTHRDFLAGSFTELHQPDRRAQARGTAADDDDIKFHRFAFDLRLH